MREFFRGWRRKLGVLTLVMACLLAAGWTRSIGEGEIILIRNSFIFTSDGGWFAVSKSVSMASTNQHGHRTARYFGITAAKNQMLIRRWPLPKDSTTRFHLGGCPQIPYWSIVIPLTLLSAYLLLSKPRPRKPPEATKPTDEAQVTHA